MAGQSSPYQAASLPPSEQDYARVVNELHDMKQLLYQTIQAQTQIQSHASNATAMPMGMHIASGGGILPHRVPVSLAPFVQPMPMGPPAAPATPAVPPATMGPDGKPIYPDLSLQFPEVGMNGAYLVLPRRRENYPRVPYFTRQQYLDHLKTNAVTVPGRTSKATRGRPRKEALTDGEAKLSLPFVTDVWGSPITNERAEYIRATGRCWWQTALDNGRAPETWRYGANTELVEEFYRHMYARFPELALADNHWKLEWICVHGYPSFKQERRAQFEALTRKRAAAAELIKDKDKIVDVEKRKKKKKNDDKKTDKGKGKARDDGQQEAEPSGARVSPSLEGALFQMPLEDSDIHPLSPPPLAATGSRKRSLSAGPSGSHADAHSDDVPHEPPTKRARTNIAGTPASSSEAPLSPAHKDPSSLTAPGTPPAPTTVPAVATIPNPLISMWDKDPGSATHGGPEHTQQPPHGSAADTGPVSEGIPLPGGDTIAPKGKTRSKAASSSKAAPPKIWPPPVEVNDKPKGRIARLWVSVNVGGTEDTFEEWYKTMDHRKRQKWYNLHNTA